MEDKIAGNTVKIGKGPHFLAVNPSTNLVYVANNKSDSILEIDAIKNLVIDKIILERPRNMVVDSETNTIYAITGKIGSFKEGNYGSEISSIDCSSKKIKKFIGKREKFQDINFDLYNKTLYAIKNKSKSIFAYNCVTGELLKEIKLPHSPQSIGFNPNNKKIYVATKKSSGYTIFVIDSENNIKKIEDKFTWTSNQPKEIHVNSNLNRVYILFERSESSIGHESIYNWIRVIDGNEDKIAIKFKPQNEGIESIAVNSNLNRLYFSRTKKNQLLIMDADAHLLKILKMPALEMPKLLVNPKTNRVYITTSNQTNWLYRIKDK